MKNDRRFEVETPLGKLLVYAKHDVDEPQDYPGVYIDFCVPGSKETVLLSCVEYDPAKDIIQTCVYGDGLTDEPTNLIEHQNLIIDEEE